MILPAWLTIAGYVVAVLQLIAALFIPFVVFFVWVLIAAIVLARRGAPPSVDASTTPAA